ncbi:VanZ family protein [Ochrobactrum sp. LMG 5442]|nr:VanZ family protein [Ochrobactrum sp. LMG 5442]
MKRIVRIGAWVILLAILAVTISPINFRPVTGEPADLERFGAFFLVGALFALAYPRRWMGVLLLTVGCAALFELMQRLAPGRHGEFIDFVFKAAGAVFGIAVGYGLSLIRPFRQNI